MPNILFLAKKPELLYTLAIPVTLYMYCTFHSLLSNGSGIFIPVAVIEHVRDGCTVRAFLLPEFHHVTVMFTGIKVCVFMLIICLKS